MYESFYHLRAKPFRLSPDPSFFYASRGHERALAYLRYGLSQAEGLVVITGAPGTGKTTLAQILLQEVEQSDVVVARLTTTQLEADELMGMVLASFGLEYEDQDNAGLLKTLEAFFMARSRENKRVLLVVDEAQNLPARSLEDLRKLSELYAGEKALLQIFLLGQEQFQQTLDLPDLERLRQRIIANYHLSALAKDECQSYVESRLIHVGWQEDPYFTDQAFKLIYEYTEGIPRRINMLCDRVLLFGSLKQQHEVNENVLRDVTDELQSEILGQPVTRHKIRNESSATTTGIKPVAVAGKNSAAGRDVTEKPDEHHSSEVASSVNHSAKNDALRSREQTETAPLPETSVPDGGRAARVMPDTSWNQMVAQAQPAEVETNNDGNAPIEMERFRVIAGGRAAEQEMSESEPALSANQSAGPLSDSSGDSKDVVLRKILRLILAFHRSPRSFPNLDDPAQPLPNGMQAIFELAVAEDQVLLGLRQIVVMGVSPSMLRSAVRFFIRRVMFMPGGDDFRVLGLPASASLDDVEVHYGLLMKLLHQDKKGNEESGIARVGDAYERLCRCEITAPIEDKAGNLSDVETVEEELDLDLSPNAAGIGSSRLRTMASDTGGGIIANDEASGPTSRNMVLIAGAIVIVFLLYLTQIKSIETVAPELAVAEPETSQVIEVPAEPVSTNLTTEVAALEATKQDVARIAEAERVIAEAEAMLRANAKVQEDNRAAKANAEAKAVIMAKLAEDARIMAVAEAKVKAEIEVQTLAQARIKKQSLARAQAVIVAKAAAAAEEEARIMAAARARTEKKARIKAVAVAKAKKEAQINAVTTAKAKTAVSTGPVKLTALSKIIATFETAYQTGDLNKLMQLHWSSVRTNDQINLDGVRGEYQILFGATRKRSIKFSNLRWQREQNIARGKGQYAVSVMRKDESIAYEETGEITLQLENRAGKLKISRFHTSVPIVIEAAKVEPVKTTLTGVNASPPSRTPAREQLDVLLDKLIQAYAVGDIEAFMQLFAQDAQTNDQATVKGIRADYEGLFGGTSFRTIDFKKMQWKWDGSVARGEGTYDVEVQANGQNKREHYQGPVWIQVEHREGGVRITHFAFSQ